MIRKNARTLAASMTLIVALTTLSGCNKGLKDENAMLWAQNQELQDELDRTRMALDAAQREAAMQPVVVAPPADAGTGFDDIAGIETFRSGGTITVRVPGDVLFASGKVDLRQNAKQTLSDIASVINGEYAGSTIRVEGYTDTDPIRKSKWKDNLELSLQRAAAVHRHLQQQGVAADRMYAAGFGEWHPRDSKATSRRVEIVVVQQE